MCFSAARLFAALATFTVGTLVTLPFEQKPVVEVVETQQKTVEVKVEKNRRVCDSFSYPKNRKP